MSIASPNAHILKDVDRTNVAAARVKGLQRDLGLNGMCVELEWTTKD